MVQSGRSFGSIEQLDEEGQPSAFIYNCARAMGKKERCAARVEFGPLGGHTVSGQVAVTTGPWMVSTLLFLLMRSYCEGTRIPSTKRIRVLMVYGRLGL